MLPPHNVRDRRSKRTQDFLRQALVTLIHEKPYDSIAVREILDRANVGRSTFYTHFRDKDDLLVSSIHDMLGSVRSADPSSPGSRYERILWFSLPIFQYQQQHRHIGGARMGTRGRAILHDHLRKVLADLIAGAVKKELHRPRRAAGQLSADLIISYISSTFILVLDWLVASRTSLSPKAADELFRSLVMPTLSAIWA